MSSSTPNENPPLCVCIRKAASSGVAKMPIRLEAEALHRAAATLPRAMDVKAMEDCTVDGRTQRNITPL